MAGLETVAKGPVPPKEAEFRGRASARQNLYRQQDGSSDVAPCQILDSCPFLGRTWDGLRGCKDLNVAPRTQACKARSHAKAASKKQLSRDSSGFREWKQDGLKQILGSIQYGSFPK